MATITKTQGISILALQSLASNSVLISTAQDVSTKLAGMVMIHFGRRSATALTESVQIRIEASAKSSGDGHWYPLVVFLTQIQGVTAQAVNGTCNAGQAVIAMASTTGMSKDYANTSSPIGNIVYVDNGTIANSEWGRVVQLSANTSITIEDNLVNAQTGSTVYPSAEMFQAMLDFTAIARIRVVVNANNTGVAVAVEAEMVTGDSIG